MAITVVNKRYHTPTSVDIYIGSGSPVGNPYPITKVLSREESIRKYSFEIGQCLHTKKDTEHLKYQEVKTYLNGIWWMNHCEGRCNLVCHCKPLACHGDIIKAIVEGMEHWSAD